MVAAWNDPPGNVPYATARIWGTGVNPVHASRNAGMGRGVAPHTQVHGVPSELIEHGDNDWDNDDFDDFGGYTREDMNEQLWGYGEQTGTADRPNMGVPETKERQSTTVRHADFPSWGPKQKGLPGGRFLRAFKRGERATVTAKTDFRRSQYADGENKVSAEPENVPNDADKTQVFMQTSETQRNKTRQGSQNSGTSNTFDAPIKSRTMGPQRFVPSGGYRHTEMFPRQQSPENLRPFLVRTAGVGPVHWMEPNADTDNTPRNRVPPDRPYAGSDVDGNANGYVAGDHVHGYTEEDVVY